MGELQIDAELDHELLQIREDNDRSCWTLGDVCVKVMAYNPTLPKHEVRDGLCNRYGFAIDTLRDRERVSRRIKSDERIYPFTFHQYRACLAAGDRWKVFAERALDSMEEYGGNPPPVRVIRNWIKGSEYEVPTWKTKLERINESLDRLVTDPNLPRELLSMTQRYMSLLAEYLR